MLTFIGRSRELDDLGAFLREGASRRGGLALLSGEPGMGKTRLAEEAADHARDAGARVVWARCTESEGVPPLWPWAQAVRALAEAGDATDPELPDLLTDGERTPRLLGEIDPAGARFRLFDRVVTFLRTAASVMPVALVLDDLQWADRSSLELLLHLHAAARDTGLVALGAYRDSEVGDALADALERLPADVERVQLVGLTREEVAALARSVSDVPIGTEMLTALYDHTGGNPFFVKELVRLLEARGELGGAHSIPESIRSVLERRLARLPPPCTEVLGVAAVIGRAFDLELLAAVAGDDASLADRLAPAVTSCVIVDEAPDRPMFVHDLFRQALYESLTHGERQRLHLAVARAIEAHHPDDLDRHLAELAHHYRAAGSAADVATAIAYGRRAGARAADLLAFSEAVEHFERTLAAVPASDRATRMRLLLDLGAVRWRAQDLHGARAAYTDAAALARKDGDADALAHAALGYGGGLGGNQPLADPDHTLVDLLEEAAAGLPEGDSLLRVRLLSRLAVELYLTDAVNRRARLAIEVVGMARRLGEPSALAIALYARQIATFGPDGIENLLADADEILALAQRAEDPELALWGHLFRVWALWTTCRPADDDLAASARLADQLGLRGYQAEVALRQAVVAFTAGDLVEADRLVELADAGAGADLAAGTTRAALLALDGQLRGPIDELEPLIVGLRIAHPQKRMWAAGLACLYAETGRLDNARAELDALAEHGFDIPRDGLWHIAMYFLAFTCFVLGDAERAGELYPLVTPHADQSALGVYGSMATALGFLDAARERWDDAFRWFDRGHERNLAAGNRAFALWTERGKAAALLARGAPGDPEAARSQLERLVDELRTLGLHGMVPATERLLEQAIEAGSDTDVPAEAGGGSPNGAMPTGREAVLRRDGRDWLVEFAGRPARLPASKGVGDLAVLLARPGAEVAAVDLVGAVVAADTGETLDARARGELRRRLAELEEDLAEAEARGDTARAEQARAEHEAIVGHLASALGLGGRARTTGDVRERARKAVTWRVRYAIRAITEIHAPLGRHLDESVRTGVFCSYQPDPEVTWRIQPASRR